MKPLAVILALGGLAATYIEANAGSAYLSYCAALIGLVGICLLSIIARDAE